SYAFQLSGRGWSHGLAVLAEQAQGKGAAATTVRTLLHGLHRALAARGVDVRSFFATHEAAASMGPVASTGAASSMPAAGPNAPAAAANGSAAPAVPDVDTVEERIRTAYAKLATEPAGWVSLADLRELLDDIPRAELDTALKWMAVQPGVRLIPVANQKSLSTRDREAALRFGGEENHAFAIEES
ncbi:MAG: hypothetical protein K6T92_01520, partial [Candidatus Rokubacteria bacterium]|nr:hypothetical protein [Candidatus Rokubacteria bacterium]